MIRVKVILETDTQEFQIAQMDVTNISGPIRGDEDEAEYVAEFSLVEGDELSLKSRQFTFKRKQFNVFALIKQAVSTLTDEELELNDKASSADMAWGLKRALRQIQGWKS